MIYFVLAALALGFVKAEKSAILELTGDAPTVHFGELGGSDVLTLVHNSTEDELVCSGKIRASDVVIEGTTTTVAQMMTRLSSLETQMTEVLAIIRSPNTICSWDVIETSESYPATSMPFTPFLARMDAYCHLGNIVRHNCTKDTSGMYYFANPWEGGGGDGIASCRGGYLNPAENYGKPADRRIACSCQAVLSPSAPPTYSPTPPAVSMRRNFTLFHTPASYSDARAACIAHGMDLVSIHDDEENSAVHALQDDGSIIWIGGTDAAQEGSFVWSDGSPWSYTHWSAPTAEPNGNTGRSGYADEDCIEMRATGGDGISSFWADRPCSTQWKFVCAKPPDSTLSNPPGPVPPPPSPPPHPPGSCSCFCHTTGSVPATNFRSSTKAWGVAYEHDLAYAGCSYGCYNCECGSNLGCYPWGAKTWDDGSNGRRDCCV